MSSLSDVALRLFFAQDFKPANLMMCLNGVVKITDFGLAAFSSKRDTDPWTKETPMRDGEPVGVLCAEFQGGTKEYFSPEQHKTVAEWKQVRGLEERDAFNEAWQLTVATSDLYQAGMTIFEMYAQYLPSTGPPGSLTFTPFDAAIRCAARTPESDFVKFSPEEAEAWLAEKGIGSKNLEGALVAKGCDGATLLKLARANDWKLMKIKFPELKLNMAPVRKMQQAIRRLISTPIISMHPSIGQLVKGEDRTPMSRVREMNAKQVFEWLLENDVALVGNQLKGAFIETNMNGAQLVEWAEPDERHDRIAEALGLDAKLAQKLCTEIHLAVNVNSVQDLVLKMSPKQLEEWRRSNKIMLNRDMLKNKVVENNVNGRTLLKWIRDVEGYVGVAKRFALDEKSAKGVFRQLLEAAGSIYPDMSSENVERWRVGKKIELFRDLLEGKIVEHNVNSQMLIRWKEDSMGHVEIAKALNLNNKDAEEMHRKLRHVIDPVKSEVVEMSPTQVESWLAKEKLVPIGELEEKHLVRLKVNGNTFLEWKSDATGNWGRKKARDTLGLTYGSADKFYGAIQKKIGICACLAEDPRERPATAADALRILDQLGYADLPAAAKQKLSEHPDENIASTLGNLAKRLVLDTSYKSALDTCAEWLGVALSEAARGQALDAYCNLWKRYGAELPRTLDLSRKSRGHWKEGMLRGINGEDFISRITRDLTHARVMPILEKIDMAEQPQLAGSVLERLFIDLADGRMPRNLHTLSLQSCHGLTSGHVSIVQTILQNCTKLQVLNLRNCNLTGAWLPIIVLCCCMQESDKDEKLSTQVKFRLLVLAFCAGSRSLTFARMPNSTQAHWLGTSPAP